MSSRHFAPPPPHAATFRSDDLDEIHAFIAAYDGSHRRAALGTGPVQHEIHAVHCAGMDVGWTTTRMRQRVRGTPRCALLHLPLARRHLYVAGGRTFESRPDTAVLLAPGQEYTLYFEPDDCYLALRLPESALAAELSHRRPDGGPAQERTCEVALRPDAFAALSGLQRALVEATSGDADDRRAQHLVARLCGWVADQHLVTTPTTTRTTLARARLRWVEEWVDAHLGEPITLGRLCAVADVGDRRLESAFRAHRGQTPLQFVAARRMAWVRRRLLAGHPATSVTQVAHDAGFVHLGRFAQRYRSLYGESPSQTLKRGAGRG
ncbi:MAG: AraC family transcriptional regulator [Burkholderiales bacterium]